MFPARQLTQTQSDSPCSLPLLWNEAVFRACPLSDQYDEGKSEERAYQRVEHRSLSRADARTAYGRSRGQICACALPVAMHEAPRVGAQSPPRENNSRRE